VIFTENDYQALSAIVFRDGYPGNATARGVVEAPNGDPAALDTGKRYSHVACKYLPWEPDTAGVTENQVLRYHLDRAYLTALGVAYRLGVPPAFLPCHGTGCLRVLEYPAHVGASAVHTDFDLFTLNLYRNVPNPGLGALGAVHMGELGEMVGLGPATPHSVDPLPVVQHSLVYFAMPNHAAVLPDGSTVGAWEIARKSRSRYSK
jgi:hypothetical protein